MTGIDDEAKKLEQGSATPLGLRFERNKDLNKDTWEFTSALKTELPKEEKDENLRISLLQQLRSEGVKVQLARTENGQQKSMDVIYKLGKGEGPNSLEVDVFLSNGREVGYVSCIQDKNDSSSFKDIQKYFTLDEEDDKEDLAKLRNVGVMRIGLSLLAEAVKAIDRDAKFVGDIGEKNIPSQKSRIDTPNIVDGGYYSHVMKESQKYSDKIEYTTYLNASLNEPQVIDQRQPVATQENTEGK